MPERIAGIDFGTSASVMCVKSYDDEGVPLGNDIFSVKSVAVNNGNSTIPTLIRKTGGTPYYGFDASVPKKDSVLHQNFKLNLESNDAVEKQQARELTKEFLTYLYSVYSYQSKQGHLGNPGEAERTLISYPVKWSEETRAFMIEAAKQAGFSNVEGVDEAQASIWSVLVQCVSYLAEKKYFNKDEASNILLIDMGAGTTDIVVCRYTYGENPKNEILSTWPKNADINFGGSEVDKILMDYIFSKIPDGISEKLQSKCYMCDFKAWKEATVSPALAKKETVKDCGFVDNLLCWVDMELEEFNLDRAEFERIAADYLSNFPKLVNGAIENSGLKNEDVDLVIVTGGHSQWYFVNEMLCGSLGNINLPKIKADNGRIIPIARPQETVSTGLVYEPLAKNITALSAATKVVEEKKNELMFRDESLKRRVVLPEISTCWRRADVRAICKDGFLYNVDGEADDVWNYEMKAFQHISSISGHYAFCLIKKDGTARLCYHWGSHYLNGDAHVEDVIAVDGRVALKADGTVRILLDHNKLFDPGWTDIVKISNLDTVVVGLKKDGKVCVYVIDKAYLQGCNLHEAESWNNIVSIDTMKVLMSQATVGLAIVGLTKDGKVLMTSCTNYDERYRVDVTQWKDIVSVSAGNYFILGLRSDGTVISTGDNTYGQCEVSGWREIVEVIAQNNRSAGIRKDGRFIYTDYEETQKRGFFATMFNDTYKTILPQKISEISLF